MSRNSLVSVPHSVHLPWKIASLAFISFVFSRRLQTVALSLASEEIDTESSSSSIFLFSEVLLTGGVRAVAVALIAFVKIYEKKAVRSSRHTKLVLLQRLKKESTLLPLTKRSIHASDVLLRAPLALAEDDAENNHVAD